jgi:hypothetical protein
MASKLNKGTASLVGDLAAIGEQRKDALRQQKRGLRLGQAQHNYAIGSDTTGLDTVMQSISGAANSLGTAWDGRKEKDYSGAFQTSGEWDPSTMTDEERKTARQYGYGA